MTLVATQVKRRRGTTAENDAFTGAEGEITVDLTTHELRVHDGSTVGGYTIPTKNYGYSKTESDNLLSNKANSALDNLTSAGKEVCAHQAMPSNKYVDLTLSAGTPYTAPADGYFTIIGSATAVNGYVMLSNEAKQMVNNPITTIAGGGLAAFLPVEKGDVVRIYYNNYSNNIFRFIYANGAQ